MIVYADDEYGQSPTKGQSSIGYLRAIQLVVDMAGGELDKHLDFTTCRFIGTIDTRLVDALLIHLCMQHPPIHHALVIV